MPVFLAFKTTSHFPVQINWHPTIVGDEDRDPALRQNDFSDGPGLEKDLDVPFGGLRLGVNYFYGVYLPT